MPLLTHNKNTLQEVEDFIKNKENCCIVNACGSGKTTIMSEFIKKHKKNTYMILTKQKNAKSYYCNKNDIFSIDNVKIRTYAKMYKDFINDNVEDYNVDYLFLDEAHYVGAPNWRRAFENIINNYNPICVGVTATPQRFEDQGTDTTIISEFFDNNSAGNYSTTDLQKMGIFIEPEYILSLYNLQDIINDKIDKITESDLSEDKKEYYLNKLTTVYKDWNKNSKPSIILNSYLPKYMYKEHCNRILVYVENLAQLPKKRKNINMALSEIFNGKKIKSYDYTYKNKESEFEDFLKEDDTYIKVLYSIDKVMETIHIDDLNIIIMLRPSVSNRIITQQFGRVNSINNKKKSLIIDMVDNLSNIKQAEDYVSVQHSHGTTKNQTVITIPHITRYYSVFEKIDACIIKSDYFTYNNIEGTLKDLCKIFCRKYETVKQFISDGLDIENAMYRSPIIFPKHKSQLRDIFNDDFVLSDSERKYAEDNTYMVKKFEKKYHFNEDDTQHMYLEYLYAIHEMFNRYTEPYKIRMSLCNRLKQVAIFILRDKFVDSVRHLSINDISEEDLELFNYITDETNVLKTHQPQIEKIFKKILTERQYEILTLRFGLSDGFIRTYDEISKRYNLTKVRIQDIVKRSLCKLWYCRELRLLLQDLEE